VNLKDPHLGVYAQCADLVRQHGVTKGRIRLSLAPGERHAGLTVNEYETLLMRHDLGEVLRDPLRFMAEKAGHMLGNPRAIPAKTPASGLPINDTRSGSVAIYAVIADGSADTLPFPLSIVAANSRSRAALLPRKALPC